MIPLMSQIVEQILYSVLFARMDSSLIRFQVQLRLRCQRMDKKTQSNFTFGTEENHQSQPRKQLSKCINKYGQQ